MATASGSVAASQEILRATIKDVRSRPWSRSVKQGSTNAYLQAGTFDSYQFSFIPPGPSATNRRDRQLDTPSSDDPVQVEPADDIDGDTAPFVASGVSPTTALEPLTIFGNAGPGLGSGGSTGFSGSSGRRWSFCSMAELVRDIYVAGTTDWTSVVRLVEARSRPGHVTASKMYIYPCTTSSVFTDSFPGGSTVWTISEDTLNLGQVDGTNCLASVMGGADAAAGGAGHLLGRRFYAERLHDVRFRQCACWVSRLS
ncbi:BZ3500_MvSof-1268-A1-R1_Chr4-1g06644 [Microbotryum saponariae]|uniref:BZ3500_MvSof-1268-A1-R1_Chr4-1g06644 protein n=1 Tax=Microbotryum saponariae TaxID=289078 RepID=A0A2X0LKA0_9BASI|nr:BZ3500_MvSof-1268-A1-R1_Chr4-1g06644 [Microbotryum saponariae]SDA06309.1 BZ3501_MvSof-1269-A2-R1_Chr4-1g06354 [Microbotryum saponariae]